MILRSRDIPELANLTEQHRQQIISQVESMVFWKVKSLLLCLALALGLVALIPVVNRVDEFFGNPDWVSGFLPAIAALTLCSLYRLVGINSFYQPIIQSLAESGLPEEQKPKMASRSESFFVAIFVLSVVLGLCLLIFSTRT